MRARPAGVSLLDTDGGSHQTLACAVQQNHPFDAVGFLGDQMAAQQPHGSAVIAAGEGGELVTVVGAEQGCELTGVPHAHHGLGQATSQLLGGLPG